MHRQFRCRTIKEGKTGHEIASKALTNYKSNDENIAPLYQKLSFKDIRQITRSVLTDPKALEKNMGVISSIKGKMYCLKLGEVSSSKQFSNYFYLKQFKPKSKKPQILKKISSNSMYSQLLTSKNFDI